MIRLLGAVLIGATMCSTTLAAETFSAEDFKPILKLNVDAGDYDANGLATIANELSEDIEAGDSFRLMTRFIRGGLSEGAIKELIDTAKKLRVVYKWPLLDSIDTVTKSFYTGYKNTQQLDGEINYLTSEESSRISSLAESDQLAATAEAYKLLRAKLDAALQGD